MSALDILDEVLLGQTAHHRRPDAWDLLDRSGRVAAIVCVRKSSGFVTIPLPPGPDRGHLRPNGAIVMPYAEEVVAHVTDDGSAPKGRRKHDTVLLTPRQASAFVARLVDLPALTRTAGKEIAADIAAS